MLKVMYQVKIQGLMNLFAFVVTTKDLQNGEKLTTQRKEKKMANIDLVKKVIF
jgi:flagella basal body P-ring formation protein FlgA